MNYLSVCSGIEAASSAWHPLGWKPVAFSEIEKFPSAVLAHHYPDVPNLGDMTKFHEWPNLDINLLVGGTPCQAFSVAGLRQGLSDPRGNLTLTFLGLADRYRPEWVVWENVPGVLSDRTNAFGQFLAGLGQLGYGWAYRMLDAQYFGVAQRRRRMFVVGCLGGWQRAAAVLFEPESLRGDSPPSREKGKGVAARAQVGAGIGGDAGADCIPIQEPGKRTGSSTNDRSYGIGLGENGDPMFTLQSGAVHGVASVAPVAPCIKGNQGKNSDAAMEAASLVAQQTFECAGIGAYKSSSSSTLLKSGSDLGPGCEALIADVAATLRGGGDGGVPSSRGEHIVPWPAQIAPTLNASFGDKQGLEDQHALNGGGFSFPTGQMPPPHITASETKSRKCGTISLPEISLCLNAGAMGRSDAETETLIPTRQGGFFDDAIAFNHNAQAAQLPSPTRDTSINDGLTCSQQAAVAFQESQTGCREYPEAGCLRANGPGHDPVGTRIRSGMSVRRLTPTECERLQGFPDGHTNIPWRNKPTAPDGPRYKALGNSMAVPCMAWIGKRIQHISSLEDLDA